MGWEPMVEGQTGALPKAHSQHSCVPSSRHCSPSWDGLWIEIEVVEAALEGGMPGNVDAQGMVTSKSHLRTVSRCPERDS